MKGLGQNCGEHSLNREGLPLPKNHPGSLGRAVGGWKIFRSLARNWQYTGKENLKTRKIII
jgi:hypothetical protein